METGEFEILAKKVDLAASLIESLKRERAEMKSELLAAQERAGTLEKTLAERHAEVEELRRDLGRKSENISAAGERIRGLVSRLEAALA